MKSRVLRDLFRIVVKSNKKVQNHTTGTSVSKVENCCCPEAVRCEKRPPEASTEAVSSLFMVSQGLRTRLLGAARLRHMSNDSERGDVSWQTKGGNLEVPCACQLVYHECAHACIWLVTRQDIW